MKHTITYKTVFAVYVKKENTFEFHQFLKLSEVKYIKNLCEDFKKVTVELTQISLPVYQIHFG